jgi:hypothetical protein
MKKLLFLVTGTLLSVICYGQFISIVAGDTSELSQHQYFNPPAHIERAGVGDPVVYNLDVNLDGFNDISVTCANSYGAMGYASNYLTVKAIDSNDVCYANVDSSYCFNGYKPVYFAKLFNISDTITSELTYTQNELIISKELWFMKDTCSIYVENTGVKYLAVRLKSHGASGLAWVNLELFAKNPNGFSADLKETGFKSVMSSISDHFLSGILVYPIPSHGPVNIYIPEIGGYMTASIFDLSGREILVKELNKKNTTLNMRKGTYMMKVSWKNSNFLVRRIIVL